MMGMFNIIGDNVEIGVDSIVESYVQLGIADRFHPLGKLVIGNRAFIGSRCTIYSGVTAGDDFDVSDQTTIFTQNIFGNRVRIGPKAVIKNGCHIGDDVRINSQVFMERVFIENNVFIGPHTVFTDDKHPPCLKYSECVSEIYIESFVSIGANVTINPGLRIGHHSQIYSGSVITENVPPNSVISGNPAKIIKGFDQLKCSAGLFERPFMSWGNSN